MAVSFKERLGLLRERDPRLLFLAQATSVLGSSMMPVALAFAILDAHGNTSDVGWVMGAQTAPLIAFLLLGGTLADRWGRRATMIGSDLVRAVLDAAVVVLLLTAQLPLAGFVVFVVLRSVAASFFVPALYGFIPEVVPEERLQEANALNTTLNSVGSLAGPALAGLLVTVTGPPWVIVIDAATFMVSALLLLAVRVPSAPRDETERQTPVRRQLLEGWREFSSRTWLWSLLLYTSLSTALVLCPAMVLGVSLVGTEHGASQWGLVLAAEGAGAVLGGLVALRLTFTRPLLVSVFCTFGLGAFAALMALDVPLVLLMAGAALSGGGFALLHVLWTSSLQTQVPAKALSRVSAYDGVATVTSMTVGYWWVGPVAARTGPEAVLWGGVVWIVLSAAVMAGVPDLRRVRPDTGAGEPEPQPVAGLSQRSE
ncbi:MFS transporter [Streptomyces sp. NPDC015171]|uniref:MFS transporter n=1 Tax=Streptomyces sp. NPDC015171 TaxID=3364945 RepID=UPI0036FB65DC